MSNSLTTYVCEGSEVVELFVFLFSFFNSNCNEGGENQKKKTWIIAFIKRDGITKDCTQFWVKPWLQTHWSPHGILFQVNLRELTATEVIVEMNRTLLFTQRRCSVFDGTHKVTLLAQKSHQVAAFCVSETNAECELMFSQVSQRPSGSWKQRGNFLTCSGNYQCLELRLQSSFGRRGHEKTLYWPTKRPCKRSSIVEH